MKKQLLHAVSVIAMLVLCSTMMMAQITVTGKITDQESGDALIGASVSEKGTSNGTSTDVDGNFKLSVQEDATLVISYVGYASTEVAVDGKSDLGSITMSASMLDEIVVTGVMDIVQDRKTPVAVSTITAAQIQANGVGNVEFPEVMKNTPSVYVSSQTGFGDSQMFLRGFDQTNTAFLLNGQPINGMEDGRMYWSNWSGMSDVANAVQVQRGLGSSKLAISSVGGTVNIVTKTVDNQKGGYVRAMVGNDNYLKGTVAYNSGMQGKWAYSILLDHWQGDNKWADGTRGQGQNYFVSVGYKPNDRNTFNFLVTGAPQWHGQRWSQSEETLAENPRFNQHWGEDQGEWESERRNFYHKPVINLTWDFEIDEQSSLASVLYASFGRGGGTGPYGSSSNRIRTAAGQVDFDAIRAANGLDTDGIGGFSDNYAIRSSMNNHQWYGNVTKYEKNFNSNLNFSVGADFRFYTGDHFRQFANLLGLDGWNDVFRNTVRPSDYVVTEQFSPDPWTALFNFADESQRIAYDYSETINYQGVFSQLEYSADAFTVFGQFALSNQSYQRQGRWADVGESETVSKIGYNLKGGASYSVNDENIVFANLGYYSRQPFLDNIFDNIRYSNALISPEIDNEEVIGLELGYKYTNNNFALDVNAYRTEWGNRTNTTVSTSDNGTPDDEADDFTLRVLERGITQLHTGLELDARYRVNKLTLSGYASFGDWIYTEMAEVVSFNDDTGVEINREGGVDINGVHVPNAPQTSFGLGGTFNITDDLTINANYNYFSRLYRRDNFNSSDPILREDIGELDPYGLLDAGISYRFMFGEQILMIRANVYNVLNTEYLQQTDPFGVINGNGTTWNTSIKFSF